MPLEVTPVLHYRRMIRARVKSTGNVVESGMNEKKGDRHLAKVAGMNWHIYLKSQIL